MRSIAILLAWLALSSDGRRIGQTLNQAKKESLGSAREVQAFNPSALGGHSLTKNTALTNPPHAVLHRHQQILASERGVIPLDDLKVGAEVEGKIVSLEPYAAFIDIGAEAIAFLHTSDVSYERINITDRFSVGEAVKCKIKEVNMKAKTLAVSLREEIGKPLDNFRIGMHVEGKIVNLQTWGAFLDIGAVTNGFLHRTEVSLKKNQTVKDVFTVDEVVKCRILDIENVPRRLSLTCIKDTKTTLEELEVGTEVEGNVLRVSSFGVFFDIGAFEDALLHRTFMLGEPPEDLTERYTVGKSFKCRLVDVDLGRKQIALAEVGKDVKILQDIVIGSEVEGTVVSHQSWGVFLDIGARPLALLHRSEVPDEYAENLKEKYPVGETVKCRIQSIDLQKSSVSVTCKEAKPLEEFAVGMEVEGKIVELFPWGASVDIGAQHVALLHKSELPLKPEQNMTDMFSLNQVVKCKVQFIMPDKKQALLTFLSKSIAQEVKESKDFEVGMEFEGEVVRIEPYGAFVDIGAPEPALVHEDDMKENLTVGQLVTCRIKATFKNKKLRASTKDVMPLENFKVGMEVEGRVTNIQSWGVFFDIGAVTDALLRAADVDLEPGETLKEKFGSSFANQSQSWSPSPLVKSKIKAIDLQRQQISLTYIDDSTEDAEVGASDASRFVKELEAGLEEQFQAFLKDENEEEDADREAQAAEWINRVKQKWGSTIGEHRRVKLGVSESRLTAMARAESIESINKKQEVKEVTTAQTPVPLESLVVGTEVVGKVMNVDVNFGAFIDIGSVTNGFLHRYDMALEPLQTVQEKLSVNDVITCRIKDVDLKQGRFSLTNSDAEAIAGKSRAPLEDLKVGTEVDAKVLRVESFGVFFDIGAVKDGFLHQSDVSLEDDFSLCEVVRCRIKEVDVENNQISLTIRRNGTSDAEASAGVSRTPLEELKVGTEIEGRITRVEQWCVFVNIGAVTNGMLHKSKMALRPKQKVKDKFSPWDWVKCRIEDVDLEKKQFSLEVVDNNARTPLEELEVGTEVEAKVVRLLSWGAFVDIGAVSDALLHKSDISLEPNQKITDKLSVDDVVKCRIKGVDVEKEQISLITRDSSISDVQAGADNSRTPLEELQVGAELEAKVLRLVPFGAFVDVGADSDGLLHKSDMFLEPNQRMSDKFSVGGAVKCTIKNVDLDKKHIELTTGDSSISDAQAIAAKSRTPLEDLKVGTEVEAKVLRLQPWGAFVDIGAVSDALLHKSDISLEPNQKITDKLSVDNVVKCRIEGVDLDMKHISLSCKDSTTSSEVAVASNASTSSSQDPEVGLEDINKVARTPLENLEPGMKVTGKIVSREDYGVFVDFGASENALLHVSDMDPIRANLTETEEFPMGGSVTCRIKAVFREKKQVSLTYKEEPLTELTDFQVGTWVEGRIKRFVPFGVFVDIGATTDALLHKSQVPGKPLQDMEERFTVGEMVKCRILDIDLSKQDVTLSLREEKKDKPILALEELKVGMDVEGRVVALEEWGAWVDIGAAYQALLPRQAFADINQVVTDMRDRVFPKQAVKCRIQGINLEQKQVTLTFKKAAPTDELEVGMQVEGKVTSIQPYAVFLDIGSYRDAIIWLADSALEPKQGMFDKFSIDDVVKCRIKEINFEKDQVFLTCRDAPTRTVEELEIGMEVTGSAVRVEKYGVFLDIGAPVDGLLHITEACDDSIKSMTQKYSIGDNITVRIVSVDAEKSQMVLTCKGVGESVVQDMENQLLAGLKSAVNRKPLSELEVGSEVDGEVIGVAPFGVFLDIGAAKDALLHRTELSGGPVQNVAKVFSMGDSVKAIIRSVDLEKELISLTTMRGKDLESLEVGTEVEGKIVHLEKWGAFVDIGAAHQALLHKSELLGEPVMDVRKELYLNQEIKCWLKSIDLEKRKVTVTCKQEGDSDDKNDKDAYND